MAASLLSSGSVVFGSPSGGNFSGNVTVAAGSNIALFLAIIGLKGGASGFMTYGGASFNGSGATRMTSTYQTLAGNDGIRASVEGFVLANPTADGAAHTLALTGISSDDVVGVLYAAYQDVDLVTLYRNVTTASSAMTASPYSFNVTCPSGDMSFGMLVAGDYSNNLAVTGGSGGTQVGSRLRDGIFSAWAALMQEQAAVNPTPSWSYSGGGGGQLGFGFSIPPAGGGGGTSIVRQMLQLHG